MSRIKIELPQEFNFTTRMKIRITDLNYGGHVGNDRFLALVHEARQEFLEHHGLSELGFAGTSLIMADAAIEFKAELRYGNEIEIAVAAADLSRAGFSLYYRIDLVEAEEKKTAAKVKTGMLCFDYTTKKLTAVPTEAKEKLFG